MLDGEKSQDVKVVFNISPEHETFIKFDILSKPFLCKLCMADFLCLKNGDLFLRQNVEVKKS